MKPSAMVFTSEPPWGAQPLPRDALVLAQDLAGPGVAEALGHRGGALDVGEEDRAEGTGFRGCSRRRSFAFARKLFDESRPTL
jgi:hypothetical protein